jgi:hypothetical protein
MKPPASASSTPMKTNWLIVQSLPITRGSSRRVLESTWRFKAPMPSARSRPTTRATSQSEVQPSVPAMMKRKPSISLSTSGSRMAPKVEAVPVALATAPSTASLSGGDDEDEEGAAKAPASIRSQIGRRPPAATG